MRSTPEGGKVTEPLVRSAPSPSAMVAEAGRSRSLRSKWRARILADDPTGRRSNDAQVVVLPQRHGERTAKGLMPSAPRNIDSLAKYRPVSKQHQVSLTFSGEAGAAMSELMIRLGLDNPNEVVKLAIALLLSVQGQEIRLRDTGTGAVQVVEI